MKYYTIEDIAVLFGISKSSAKYRIYKLGFKKNKMVNKNAVYSQNIVDALKKVTVLYYPLKTTVTYHIYESKMNYD